MGNPQKFFVNQTAYIINGTIIVRLGSTPGQESGQVSFTLNPNQSLMVPYGDPSDPYVDQLTLSAMVDNGGAVVLSDQVVITRGSNLDNLFNTNDTVYINVVNDNFVINTGNTWTV